MFWKRIWEEVGMKLSETGRLILERYRIPGSRAKHVKLSSDQPLA